MTEPGRELLLMLADLVGNQLRALLPLYVHPADLALLEQLTQRVKHDADGTAAAE